MPAFSLRLHEPAMLLGAYSYYVTQSSRKGQVQFDSSDLSDTLRHRAGWKNFPMLTLWSSHTTITITLTMRPSCICTSEGRIKFTSFAGSTLLHGSAAVVYRQTKLLSWTGG